MKRAPKLETFNRVITTLIFAGIVVGLALFMGPVQAKVALEAPMGGGAVVLLHDEAGPCVGGALLAEYVSPDGSKVPGCWVKRPGHVAIVFFDGDVGAVPEGALQKPKSI